MYVYALFLVGKTRDFNNVLRKKLESYMSATGSMVTLNLKTLLKDIKISNAKNSEKGITHRICIKNLKLETCVTSS